eukprot:5368408-Karenia_brevis.AAC.1
MAQASRVAQCQELLKIVLAVVASCFSLCPVVPADSKDMAMKSGVGTMEIDLEKMLRSAES